MKSLSAVQQFVLDGYRMHAGRDGLVCDDLDKLLRGEDPEGLLGPVEKRRCNHASSQLKKRGLIEQCGTVRNGPTQTGVYRDVFPVPVAEPAVLAGAEEAVPAPLVAPAPVARKGAVFRRGDWSLECPPDATPEFVADLMNKLPGY